jgi:hypothetical protein
LSFTSVESAITARSVLKAFTIAPVAASIT